MSKSGGGVTVDSSGVSFDGGSVPRTWKDLGVPRTAITTTAKTVSLTELPTNFDRLGIAVRYTLNSDTIDDWGMATPTDGRWFGISGYTTTRVRLGITTGSSSITLRTNTGALEVMAVFGVNF